MTDAENLARARAWLRCDIGLDSDNTPVCAVHGWDTRRCIAAFRETLTAAMRAKGKMDARRIRPAPGASQAWQEALGTAEAILNAHAADVPEVPS